jgi:hypothetical protein
MVYLNISEIVAIVYNITYIFVFIQFGIYPRQTEILNYYRYAFFSTRKL